MPCGCSEASCDLRLCSGRCCVHLVLQRLGGGGSLCPPMPGSQVLQWTRTSGASLGEGMQMPEGPGKQLRTHQEIWAVR